jgi:hypothetical protein
MGSPWSLNIPECQPVVEVGAEGEGVVLELPRALQALGDDAWSVQMGLALRSSMVAIAARLVAARLSPSLPNVLASMRPWSVLGPHGIETAGPRRAGAVTKGTQQRQVIRHPRFPAGPTKQPGAGFKSPLRHLT